MSSLVSSFETSEHTNIPSLDIIFFLLPLLTSTLYRVGLAPLYEV